MPTGVATGGKGVSKRVRWVAAWLGLLCWGCGSAQSVPPQDASTVEMLRSRVSKVRHAIEQTREALAQAQGSAYAPELNLRLAELLSEEARYHYRVAQLRSSGETKALHVPQVRMLKEQAIALYEEILERFPDAPLRDRALYNLSFEHRELGEFDPMLAALNRLVDELPDSDLRNDALLLLGDYYFDRNELQQAKGYYERITEGPVHPVSPVAHYKLAWVWVNEGRCKVALQDFAAAVALARDSAEQAGQGDTETRASSDIDVRRSAVVDSVYCFSLERPALEAVPFLRKMSHDRATYVAGLERMARRLAVMNHAAGTAAVVRELLRVGPPEQERLEDARQLHAAVRTSKAYDQAGPDAVLIAGALHAHATRVDVEPGTLDKLEAEFEAYVRDLLTRGQGQLAKLPSSQQVEAAAALAVGYREYDRTFLTAKTRVDMLLNLADIYGLARDPFEAGNAALRAAFVADPQSAAGQDALYDAVVHFQTALGPAEGVTDGRRRTLARAALRRSGRALLGRSLSEARERRVKFAVAETFYWEGEHRRAVDYLSAVAYEFPRTKEADAAVRLLLDSLNLVNDFPALSEAGRRFSSRNAPVSAEVQAEIPPIIAAAEQRMIDEVSLEAAGEDGGDLSGMLEFAKSHQGDRLGERALLNAFMAARAMGETDKVYTLGDQLLTQYPKSEELPGVVSTLSQMALARSDFERALKYFQSASQSGHPQRGELQVAAGQLQADLGDWRGAQATLRQALQDAKAGSQRRALVELAVLAERYGDAHSLLADVPPHIDQAPPEVLARLGLAQLEAGQGAEAERTLRQVLNRDGGERTGAAARAHYGLAELQAQHLAQSELQDPSQIQTYLGAVETARQSYVQAVREGDADYTPLALGRLAVLAQRAAERVRQARLPSELSEQERAALGQAVEARAAQLEQTADEALAACAEQAFKLPTFSPAARDCLANKTASSAVARFDRLRQRQAGRSAQAPEALRQRLAKNAEDAEARLALAEAYLDGGDYHSARLLLADAAGQGSPRETNLLGIAHYGAGAVADALAAFQRAAAAQLEAGRQNLATALQREGLDTAARQVMQRYGPGRDGGRLLGGGGR